MHPYRLSASRATWVGSFSTIYILVVVVAQGLLEVEVNGNERTAVPAIVLASLKVAESYNNNNKTPISAPPIN
jgi:hypothetical protein